MQPESLVQLVGSGNTTTVEAEWMRLVESAETTPAVLRRYQPVLAELVRVGKAALAEEWAWTAIEAMSTQLSPKETLSLAGAFLLAIGDSKELRAQVAELYRAAYAGTADLETLLSEAGLVAGRPVRRALRTLEVCLAVKEGDFLASRDQDEAARVVSVDPGVWRFTTEGASGTHAWSAVELADEFRPADPDEFIVLRQFAPDKLRERLENDPAGVIVELCRNRGGTLSSEQLESVLSPEPLTEADYDKWWSRARTLLKKCSNVQVEGRSPYLIRYVEAPVALDEAFAAQFDKAREPHAQLETVEKYVRECKSRGEAPSGEALHRCFEKASAHAKQMAAKHAARAGLAWAAAGRIGELAGATEPWRGLTDYLRTVRDVPAALAPIDDALLFDRTCDCLVKARASDWAEILGGLLSSLPAGLCDAAAKRLEKAGWGEAQFEAFTQRVLASPAACFESLLWLWDGPSLPTVASRVSSLTVLTRILRVLDEARRGETIGKERARTIALRARTVLAGRRNESFVQCLEGMDPGMASALRTQILQLDNLGRAVREDLLDHLRLKFPVKETKPQLEAWAREDVIYVTAAALAKKKAEIEHHVNVKMRDNARAIGAAAERGDLSENSEYKFALEERDLLRARLAQMNAEFSQAVVLNPGDVSTDRVSIGTRVVFERLEDGERYELTIASPWDADHTKNWFNYKAPMSQAILGKRVGDVVPLDHAGASGSYRIAELHNALSPLTPAPATA